jgi:transcription elongation factor GreB
VSKAFTKEDAGGEDLERVPKLEPWPAGVKNYLTPEGYRDLVSEIEWLRHPDSKSYRTRAWREARLNALASRLAAAEVVEPPKQWKEDDPVRFGATVTFIDEGMYEEYRIVGVDETHKAKTISWTSPLARALLGKRPGEWVTVRLPGQKKRELFVFSVKYEKPKRK